MGKTYGGLYLLRELATVHWWSTSILFFSNEKQKWTGRNLSQPGWCGLSKKQGVPFTLFNRFFPLQEMVALCELKKKIKLEEFSVYDVASWSATAH